MSSFKSSRIRAKSCSLCGEIGSHDEDGCFMHTFFSLPRSSIETLKPKHLKLFIATQDGSYAYFLCKDKSDCTSYFQVLLNELLGNSGFSATLVKETRTCATKEMHRNCLYGHFDQVWGNTTSTRETLMEEFVTYLCNEKLLKKYLLLHKPNFYNLHSLRLPDNVVRQHHMHNAIAAIIGKVQDLNNLCKMYKQKVEEHADRVSSLYCMPLQDILQACKQNSEKTWKEYFINALKLSNEERKTIKMKIHFHLVEELFDCIRHNTWRCTSNAANPIAEQDYCLSHLAYHQQGPMSTDTSDYGLLLTVYRTTKKIEIDVPGGKRELGETPLDCMIRETWEEIGFDLSHARIRGEDSIIIATSEEIEAKIFDNSTSVTTAVANDWLIAQHRWMNSMSCFVVVYNPHHLSPLPTAQASLSSSSSYIASSDLCPNPPTQERLIEEFSSKLQINEIEKE